MRRLRAALGLICALLIGAPAFAHPLITPAPAVKAGVPTNYFQIWGDEFNGSTLDIKKNGPLQWNRDTGPGTWSYGQNLQQELTGGGGQESEYLVDGQYAGTVGGGYPAQGQASVSGGFLTITNETTPASIASLLPATYSTFTHTCSIAATDMTCTAATSGIPLIAATITGTGVTAGTKITAYGTNASSAGCTPTCHYTVSISQTVASTAISSTGAWPYVSAWLSTRSSVAFKPPYCIWMRGQSSSQTGSWTTLWTQTRNQNIQNPTYGQVEFDILEDTPTGAPSYNATNYHWNADDSGGTYFNAGILTKMPYPMSNGMMDFVVCAPKHVGELATWYVNGVLVNSYKIPTSTVYENTYHYPVLTLAAGYDSWPGVFVSPATFKVDFIRVFKPIGSIGSTTIDTNDYFISTAGDGLGAERLYGPNPLTSGYTGGWSTDAGASVSSGSSVDSLPIPAVVTGPASGGSFGLTGVQWSGNSTFGAGVNNGTYKFQIDYNYGTSGSIMGQIYTPTDGAFYRFTATGTTVTVTTAGLGCSGTITTVGSHKHFECTITVGASGGGYFNTRFSPNSDSGSQTATLYQMSIKPTSPSVFP